MAIFTFKERKTGIVRKCNIKLDTPVNFIYMLCDFLDAEVVDVEYITKGGE